MPAEFRNDTIRNFFRIKFEEFIDNVGNFDVTTDDKKESFLCDRRHIIPEDVDFKEYYIEKRKIELEYIRKTDNSCSEEVDVDVDSQENKVDIDVDGDSPMVTGYTCVPKKDGKRNCYRFNAEAEKAEKNCLDVREVCLID